jgi:ABC-2 type transport system ATP-binding protein
LLGKPDGDADSKAEIGVMFDQPYFQDDWTPRDIEKGTRPFYPSWDSDKYYDYLARFELDPKKKFKTFSRGMKMKLSMAVHLSHDTKLLLLDEPTGGLDPVARDEVLDIIRNYLVREDRTVLLSTHITSDLERIADMIVYISRGVVSYWGDKEELISRYCVVRGSQLPDEKRGSAIGAREHANGFECLMALEHIGGLSADTVTERPSIDDVIVYFERNSKYA